MASIKAQATKSEPGNHDDGIQADKANAAAPSGQPLQGNANPAPSSPLHFDGLATTLNATAQTGS